MIVPPGVDLHTFHPCNQPVTSPIRSRSGYPGDLVRRAHPAIEGPDVLIKLLPS